jgi:hypothetical protein
LALTIRRPGILEPKGPDLCRHVLRSKPAIDIQTMSDQTLANPLASPLSSPLQSRLWVNFSVALPNETGRPGPLW